MKRRCLHNCRRHHRVGGDDDSAVANAVAVAVAAVRACSHAVVHAGWQLTAGIEPRRIEKVPSVTERRAAAFASNSTHGGGFGQQAHIAGNGCHTEGFDSQDWDVGIVADHIVPDLRWLAASKGVVSNERRRRRRTLLRRRNQPTHEHSSSPRARPRQPSRRFATT
eukprot:6198989-Pleurochrysis_carterae.AAC.1